MRFPLALGALALLTGASAPAGPGPTRAARSCDVKEIYEEERLPAGTKGIVSMGRPETVYSLLRPATLKRGSYEVRLSDVGSDFYRVDGQPLYIETYTCMESFLLARRIVLRVGSGSILGKGSLEIDR